MPTTDSSDRGPRNYKAGVREALFALAGGACAYPGCTTDVITLVEGDPVIAVEICHMAGANPGSARFDPTMTNPERAAYRNLILLCTPHHKTVDLHPDRYPISTLESWKAAAEGPVESAALADGAITAETLAELIEQAARHQPVRRITVEQSVGFFHDGNLLAWPLEATRTIITANPSYAKRELVLVTTVRNTGTTVAWVDEISPRYKIRSTAVPQLPAGWLTLVGQNTSARLNPELPYRLPGGASVNWLTSEKAFLEAHTASLNGVLHVDGVDAQVRLGSGEVIPSKTVLWADVGADLIASGRVS